MSRSGTANLNLGTWVQGEKPGAGAQGSDSDGLNGNAYKIDVALGVGHTAAGAHKANAITATALAAGCVDGASIQGAAGSAIAIKTYATGTDGVQKTHLNPNVADASTLEKDASVGLRIKDAGVTGAKLASSVADGTTIELSGGSLRIKDDGVTAPKISHDNNRTKALLQFTVESNVSGTWAKFGGLQTSGSYAPAMPRAGSVTKVAIRSSSGISFSTSQAYGNKTFAAGDTLTIQFTDSPYSFDVMKNGSSMTFGTTIGTPTISSWMFVVEVEFDD